jgi:hypothetical protein
MTVPKAEELEVVLTQTEQLTERIERLERRVADALVRLDRREAKKGADTPHLTDSPSADDGRSLRRALRRVRGSTRLTLEETGKRGAVFQRDRFKSDHFPSLLAQLVQSELENLGFFRLLLAAQPLRYLKLLDVIFPGRHDQTFASLVRSM